MESMFIWKTQILSDLGTPHGIDPSSRAPSVELCRSSDESDDPSSRALSCHQTEEASRRENMGDLVANGTITE